MANATQTRTHGAASDIEDELEAAAAEHAEPEDETDLEEDEEDDEATPTGADGYGKLEARLRKRTETMIAKRTKRQEDSLEAYRKRLEERMQQRLDEYALSQGGTVQNVEATREAIQRQVAAHEKQLQELQSKLAKLSEAETAAA